MAGIIGFQSSGDFKNTDSFLAKMLHNDMFSQLESYGKRGVEALAKATPSESGRAANSWDYYVEKSQGSYAIVWTNSDIENGFPVAVMLHYGHGTGTGGYVEGTGFINPALKPIFEKAIEEVWKAVKSA